MYEIVRRFIKYIQKAMSAEGMALLVLICRRIAESFCIYNENKIECSL